MCGRFTLTSTPEQLAQRFGLDEPPQAAPRYNIAPGQDVLAIRLDAETARRVAIHPRWGLVPSWAKDAAIGARMINARSETVAEKPAFRAAFRARRCLVPADGFYEWAPRQGGKQAHYIALRDAEPFGFAGLWERWEDPSGDALESCTLLTRDAVESIRGIHHRMPVILDPTAYEAWLDPARDDPTRLFALLRPPPEENIVWHPVSNRVNDVRVDDPACIAPAPEAPRQGALF
jgi:putative SOS response-associated peptidase YedK